MDKLTRSQVIGHLIADAVIKSRTQWNAYAAAVVAHYHANVDVVDRAIEFHVATTAENHDHATRLNTQTVRRILLGEQKMLVDVEESLIAALPTAWRERVLGDLLDRQGLLLARKPEQGGLVATVRTPCELLRNAAAAVERIAPMLEDGQIGPEDEAHFAEALRAINQVMGSCVSVTTQITDVMTRKAPRGGLRAVKS